MEIAPPIQVDVMEMTPPTGEIFKLNVRFSNEGYGIINVEDAMTPLNANGNDTTVSE